MYYGSLLFSDAWFNPERLNPKGKKAEEENIVSFILVCTVIYIIDRFNEKCFAIIYVIHSLSNIFIKYKKIFMVLSYFSIRDTSNIIKVTSI